MPVFPSFSPLAKALMMRRLLKPGLLSASLGVAMALPAISQAQDMDFNIAAQPLSSALLELGRQAGVQVLFEPTSITGLRGNAVKGRMSTNSALATLLKGSSLRYSLQDNTVTVTPGPSDASSVQLDPTNVSSRGLGEVSEGTGSYTTGSANTATKLALSARETPQSVSVVTRQRIEDQNMTTLTDVVKNTPGLSVTQWGAERPRFYSRGMSIENLMYDGLPVAYEEAALSTGALAMFDRVEVVRGATGIMEGAGLPSGSINLIRKRPTTAPQVIATASLGSWDNRRFELDAGSALNEQGTLRGRTVLSYQKKNSFNDDASNERTLLYGILEADLSDATTLSLGASYNDENNPGADWNGRPTNPDGSFIDVSRSTRLSPSYSYWNKNSKTFFAEIEHRFDNDWKAKGAATYITSEMDMLGTFVRTNGTDANGDRNITLGGGGYHYDRDQYSLDGYFSGPFQLGGRTHSLVFGGSHRVSKWDDTGGTATLNGNYEIASFNPYNWDPDSVAKPDIAAFGTWGRDQRVEQQGVYSTARFSLADPLTLMVGGRLDWYESRMLQSFTGFTYNPVKTKETRKFTPYVGMVYDLNETYSVYASWTQIFQPQTVTDTSGSALKPIEGSNYEIGLKGEYFNGRLNTSIAVFQADLENQPVRSESSDPTNPCTLTACYDAAGKVRTRGIELEASGALTENWQVAAGYTYSVSELIDDTGDYKPEGTAIKGKRFATNLPSNLFKLSTSYRLPGDLNQWRVGGAMYTQSRIYSYGTTSNIKQGGYTLVDLNASYDVDPHLQLGVNFNNVFDKHYYSSILSTSGGNVVGDPRNFAVTARYKF